MSGCPRDHTWLCSQLYDELISNSFRKSKTKIKVYTKVVKKIMFHHFSSIISTITLTKMLFWWIFIPCYDNVRPNKNQVRD